MILSDYATLFKNNKQKQLTPNNLHKRNHPKNPKTNATYSNPRLRTRAHNIYSDWQLGCG
jgi:hypothetical protein